MKFFPASGGSATYAYNLALGLHQQGYRVMVLAPAYGKRRADATDYPFTVKRMRWTNEKFALIRHVVAFLYVWNAYRRYQPQAVWATTYAGCAVLGFSGFRKTKLIGTIHGGGIHRRFPMRHPLQWFGNKFGLRFFRRADAVVTVSYESKKMMIERMGNQIKWKNLQVIYNGIHFDETRFISREVALQRKPEWRNKKIILTVGRLVRAKGHDVIIRALPELIQDCPDIAYIIVGEGEEKENLKQLVQQVNLENVVHFTGYVTSEEMEIYYGLCEVFAMAGRETDHFIEGFGLVYIEAGIRGKPVIGTRVGGIPEAVKNGETGFLVEPEQPGQIAEKVRLLFNQPDLRKRMGQAAIDFVRANFTTHRMAEKNKELLESLMTYKPQKKL